MGAVSMPVAMPVTQLPDHPQRPLDPRPPARKESVLTQMWTQMSKATSSECPCTWILPRGWIFQLIKGMFDANECLKIAQRGTRDPQKRKCK